MLSTTIKSARKSKASLKKSRRNLTAKGEDFWSFYNENRAEIDSIIDKYIYQATPVIDRSDMHNEILVRLHRNNFLKQYKSERSKLNTYLTWKVRAYAGHIASEAYNNQCREQTDCARIFRSLHPHQESLESNFDFSQKYQALRSLLPEYAAFVLQKICKGYKQVEIARYLGINPAAISFQLTKIKRALRQIQL